MITIGDGEADRHHASYNSLESFQLSILSLLSPHVITPQCPLNKWYLSQECTLDPCQLDPSHNCEENGSCFCRYVCCDPLSSWSIHRVHLLTLEPAFIWVMLLNHVKVLAGRLSSWGTESWDMGHPVSYDHHTLGPNMRPSHWLMPHDLGSDWPLARVSGKAGSRHKHKESQEIQQTLWTVAPGNDTGLWWQCGDRHHGAPGPVPVAREELLKVARTAITFPDGLLVLWDVWEVRLSVHF